MLRNRTDPHPALVEIVPSRWDDEPIQRSASMLAALSDADGLSLEFAATADALRFYVRAGSDQDMGRVLAQVRAAYPQAELRPVPIVERPELDPAWRSAAEEVVVLELGVQRGPDLPLTSDWRHRNDPLSAVLTAAAEVGEGERVVCQLALASAPAGWADRLRARLAPPEVGRPRTAGASPLSEAIAFLAFLALGATGLRAWLWYEDGRIFPLLLLAAGAVVLVPLVALLASRFLDGRQAVDRSAAEEKLGSPAFAVRLRIAVFAPAGTSAERLSALAASVASAYQAFDHPAGNGLRPHRRARRDETLTQPVVKAGMFRPADVLNAAELAGLWHLPVGPDARPKIEYVQSRRLLLAPEECSRGCPVGVLRERGREAAVHMPVELLHRNQLVVAKTRRGKSTLLLHQARYLMERMAAGERLSLVVIDPHQDLAEPVLAAVPPGLEDRVVYLNLADVERPLGLNLLDPDLFPRRDRTAENVVTMLHRLWPENWGPRMEGALRAAVLSLYEANRSDVRRPEDRFTLLDVVPLLGSPSFREEVLAEVPDLALQAWWHDNYEALSRTFQQQTANPVTTKVGRFTVTEAARLVLGQARSTIDPRSLLREGGVLVVNSAVGVLGEGGAALMGATILNLIALVVEEQVALPPRERSRLVALVDESSTLGAADYSRMLSELGKYGASFVLVTQSLAKLDAIHKSLRPTVFANVDGLTVFQVSAEDARYLGPELDGHLDLADLTDLEDFDCYARWWSGGRRLPAFSLTVAPPPAFDRDRLRAIALRSAERYGRSRAVVAAEIDARLRRHLQRRPAKVAQETKADAEATATLGEEKTQPTSRTNPKPPGERRRNDNRDRR